MAANLTTTYASQILDLLGLSKCRPTYRASKWVATLRPYRLIKLNFFFWGVGRGDDPLKIVKWKIYDQGPVFKYDFDRSKS